jgi:serine O-acetyltransferase
MRITIGRDKLNELIIRQLVNIFFLDHSEKESVLLSISEALQRSELCFIANTNKYYWDENGDVMFHPYHSVQYCIFLYFLSRVLFLNNHNVIADKVYYLNKIFNCLDLYYEIEMPDVFFIDHPVGSVMGRGKYGNYFIFQQNCTVGGNHGVYPEFGEYVWMFANSTVIGNSKIGNNVFISATTYIKDQDIPDNTIVFGNSPNLLFKSKPVEYFYKVSVFRKHKNYFL